MKSLLSFFLLPALLTLFPAFGAAQDRVPQDLDVLNERRIEPEANRQALALCDEHIKNHPEDAEAYWKGARAAWWLGSVLTERKERLNVFERGMALGEKAVQLAPKSAEARFWWAGNMGSYGDVKGVMKSLSLLGPIRRELAAMNAIDDTYQSGGAYRILGIVDYKVPGFAGGNKKRARERLEKALAIDPEHPATLYYLAEYFYEMGDNTSARSFLERWSTTRTPRLEAEWKLMEPKATALRRRLP